MKKEIVKAFDSVTMPAGCAQKIRTAAAAEKKPGRRNFGRRLCTLAAAFAAALLMLFALSPEARAAVEEWVVKYIFPESGITVYEQADLEGNVTGVMVVDTGAPPFAEVRGDRLYFTGNGEKIDITDQITEEKPFYYSYTDDYGLTHYMVVGYSGTIENFGIYEFMREEKEGQRPWEGWSNGSGRNFLNPETETPYPWVDIVWEELNVPWPKPE